MNRRRFLQSSGLAAVSGLAAASNQITSAPPVQWAVGELRDALKARSLGNQRISVHAASGGAAESFTLAMDRGTIAASAPDSRGLVYALLEAADRVRLSGSLGLSEPLREKPANTIRSITRCFVSDTEDKAWFYDRTFWRGYLTMLASQRYNRFSLTLGLGYNAPRGVTDAYFYFAYPFLLTIPGYDVRASGLADSERDRNLETLQFIAKETVARGLQFQLGLWTHAYQWVNSPEANYTITGLSEAKHAPYCRDALAALLKACPQISGLTFRIHGESGIPEGSYGFWRTLFEAVAHAGRPIEIDMHAKGMDQETIDIALATGMPVNVSPKYWAEHMGMPYHQASIRQLEMPPKTAVTSGPYTLSNGSRKFLRYGYGDLLREDRKWRVLHRIWPGTQRLLLWGDPVFAAGYGRVSSFCGSAGVELMEPLSFKGRIGTGHAGGRCGYADKSLEPRYDWEKFSYQYRVWGRLIYNPDADPDGWRRELRRDFGADAEPAEQALASASRILPVITTTHGASGSNNTYWPEIYTNMPIVDAARNQTYRDTVQPGIFGNVSSFDPQLFASITEANSDGRKYTPLEVADWLEKLAIEAQRNLASVASSEKPAVRRLTIDTAIQADLGRFFAWKIRAAVLHSAKARDQALEAYRNARHAWASLSERAKNVYVADLSYGPQPHLRGHWLDRLAAIDADIADLAKTAGGGKPIPAPQRPAIACRHTPAPRFRPGEALEIALSFSGQEGRSAECFYRRVNQAEAWRQSAMQFRDGAWRTAVPAGYTQSPYALQYYFVVSEPAGKNIYPGFNPNLTGLPYFVVRSS
jgi:hypothetical protein